MSIDISIIIPAKNGSKTLDDVLKVVTTQDTVYTYEVIVIDSGSSDNTVIIAEEHKVRIHSILPTEFSHSKTRNLGASLANANKYLIFLNQDAVPVNDQWLNNLVKSIEYHPSIKAACAMELDKRRRYLNVSGVAGYAYRNSAVEGIYVIRPNLVEQNKDMVGEELRQLFPFTTVCAIFEKEHFMRYPFDEKVVWGEDLHWAVMNSHRGYTSACTSFAKVYHHHDYTPEEIKEILGHTARIYKELFDYDFDIKAAYDSIVNGCPSCKALKNSFSWRLTAPIRKIIDIFRGK